MEVALIIALLVSNVWLIRKVLNKPETVLSSKNEAPVSDIVENIPEPQEVVGASSFDIRQFTDSVRDAAKEAAVEAAKEVIPLIIKEMGTPADAGLPDEKEDTPPIQVPAENLDKVFTNLSASELTGDAPIPAEPDAEGIDFDEIQRTMDVLKDKPHTPEDVKTARRVLNELEGTELIEYVKLDPVVRKRILMIECRLPDLEDENGNVPDTPSDETPPPSKPRKIVFHADIDTTDIDAIDFNILH